MDAGQIQAWLHVAVVHVPVILAPLSLYLMIRGKRSDSREFLRLGHTLSVLVALTSAVAYFTGPTTVEWWQSLVEWDSGAIEDHGLWGRISFTILALAGVGSVISILAEVQEEKPHPWIFHGVAWLLTAGVLCLIWTSHLGGLLRRPELAF